ncbi:MAG: hypothetical protein QXO75_09650, partial [Nitrososphaerota archaeon]
MASLPYFSLSIFMAAIIRFLSVYALNMPASSLLLGVTSLNLLGFIAFASSSKILVLDLFLAQSIVLLFYCHVDFLP